MTNYLGLPVLLNQPGRRSTIRRGPVPQALLWSMALAISGAVWACESFLLSLIPAPGPLSTFLIIAGCLIVAAVIAQLDTVTRLRRLDVRGQVITLLSWLACSTPGWQVQRWGLPLSRPGLDFGLCPIDS